MKWSEDNPALFVTMEKGRMYIFRGANPEEPIQSNAYICSFSDLCIKTVLLDELMQDPENPSKAYMKTFETKSLRDTRQLLATCPLEEAFQFVEDNPHPRLWSLLAESSLRALQLSFADKAFVRCKDYHGIQLVKRLFMLAEPARQQAEIAAYLGRFDEAEALYQQIGREDLAIALRTCLGDWSRVISMLTAREEANGGGVGQAPTNSRALAEAYNMLGEYFAERQRWQKAQSCFREVCCHVCTHAMICNALWLYIWMLLYCITSHLR